MLCVISSKKSSILFKWAIRVRKWERLGGTQSGWLVERFIRVDRMNRVLVMGLAKRMEGSFMVLKGRKLERLEGGCLMVPRMLVGTSTH